MRIILEKYYFDGVTSEGDVFIGYEGSIKLFWFTFSFSGILFAGCNGNSNEHFAWKSGSKPEIESDLISWSPEGSASRFTWKGCSGNCEELLYTDSHSRIRWSCLASRAEFIGDFGNKTFTGLGYSEKVEITLSSLKLPFKELLWGRAHIGHDSLVWINWKHGLDKCWIWLNGKRVDGRLIGAMPDEIHINGEIYILYRERLIRKRPVYSALKKAVRILSGGLSNAREEKILGTVIQHSSGRKGTALYERIVWE